MDPYKRVSAREIYRNRWLAVQVHEMVHPTGVPGEHLLVVPAPAIAVLVEDGEDFIFTTQPRFAAGRHVLEVVKGGADPSETPLEAAQRELREELGVEAAQWTPLGEVLEIPSIVAPAVTSFLASDITQTAMDQEDVESVSPVRVPIEEVLGGSMTGEIEDAVTLALLFRYLMLP